MITECPAFVTLPYIKRDRVTKAAHSTSAPADAAPYAPLPEQEDTDTMGTYATRPIAAPGDVGPDDAMPEIDQPVVGAQPAGAAGAPEGSGGATPTDTGSQAAGEHAEHPEDDGGRVDSDLIALLHRPETPSPAFVAAVEFVGQSLAAGDGQPSATYLLWYAARQVPAVPLGIVGGDDDGLARYLIEHGHLTPAELSWIMDGDRAPVAAGGQAGFPPGHRPSHGGGSQAAPLPRRTLRHPPWRDPSDGSVRGFATDEAAQ
jgi:hypothetical protein